MDTQTLIVIGVAVGVLAVASAIAYVLSRRRRSSHLHSIFGPEYEREVARIGDPRKAEEKLLEREKRVMELHIKPVPADLKDRYLRSWKAIQARFVDEPGPAVTEADGLVRKVMDVRGYPMGDFEQQAADISVDHPHVVENYRTAHAIALLREKGQASTEDLRQAFIHYRLLFEDLLDVKAAVPAEVVHA